MVLGKSKKKYDPEKLKADIEKLRKSSQFWGEITGVNEQERMREMRREAKEMEEEAHTREWAAAGKKPEKRKLFSSMKQIFAIPPEMRGRKLEKGNAFEKNGVQYQIVRVHRNGKTLTVQKLPLGKIRQLWNIRTKMSGLGLRKVTSGTDARKLRKDMRRQMRR